MIFLVYLIDTSYSIEGEKKQDEKLCVLHDYSKAAFSLPQVLLNQPIFQFFNRIFQELFEI